MTSIQFGLLGPLSVRRDGEVVPVPAAKQRIVLAALLLNANRVVSIGQLINALWTDKPPESARVTLQNYIRRLRLAIGDTDHSRIITTSAGYSISAGVDEVDVSLFEALRTKARAAAGDGAWEQASHLLATAQSLWRGQPLADIPSDPAFLVEVQRLANMRLEVVEARIDADLHLGRHAEVIIELEQQISSNPLRERLYTLLMLAFYRDGRQVDALNVYQQARRTLLDEFGLEPGAELRRIHQQILAGDDSPPPKMVADTKTRSVGIAGAIPAVPRQLPAAVPDFVGREHELRELRGLVDKAARTGGVGVAVISGSAGIGKTALAVHFGRQVVGQFPDGQFFIDLAGFSSSRPPVTPAAAIRRFLDGLQVPARRIPVSQEAQADLYRSLMAGRRMLVVLDNARDAEQVRPLLPGGAGCSVIVTSRNGLTGLIATEGACPLPIGVLSEDEAIQLATRRLGAGRIADGGACVAELISLCARLPLALVIATANVSTGPRVSLATLTTELRDTRDRLSLLDAEDTVASVRTSFSWSYQLLSQAVARVFRLLGIHPGPDISTAAAASLAGIDCQEARLLLGTLTEASLLSERDSGRFAQHDLLHLFAAEMAGERDSDETRRVALERLLDHYLHTAWAANRLLNPARDPIALAPPSNGTVVTQLASHVEALRWFSAEHGALLAAVTHAAAAGFDVHAWQIAWTMADFVERQGRWHDWVATQRTALTATYRLGDHLARARSHRGLGFACARMGSFREAYYHLAQALRKFREVGDRVGEARSHLDLSWTLDRQGRIVQALRHDQQALALFRAASHTRGQATALSSIGWLKTQCGDYDAAVDYCRQALELHRQLGNRRGEAASWDSLGYAWHNLRQYAKALTCYAKSLVLFRELGDRYSETEVLTHIGDSEYAYGHTDAARGAWQQAVALLEDLGHSDVDLVRAKLEGIEVRPPTT
ncbi:MAG TPA: BTAD domain-containing putative transcriptional regulator [Streptosporangiaceae bacterium]